MKVGILIQARISSTRLPGKVLFKLGNTKFNSINLIYKRISQKNIRDFAEIVFLTSKNKCDDAINYFCESEKIPVFRGEEDDVLDRYFQASKNYSLDQIIRLTSDCPFIDPAEILRIFKIHNLNGNDYTTNSFENSSVVDGCDVEVFNFTALLRAHKEAFLKKDREHVTTFFSKKNNFKCGYEDPGLNYPYTRLTLDNPEDFKVISELINIVSDPVNSKIEEFVQIYFQKGFEKYNNFITRNSGWDK